MKVEKAVIATLDNGATLMLSRSTLYALRFMLAHHAMIHAIKFVREVHGCGLKDAKDVADYLRDNPALLD